MRSVSRHTCRHARVLLWRGVDAGGTAGAVQVSKAVSFLLAASGCYHFITLADTCLPLACTEIHCSLPYPTSPLPACSHSCFYVWFLYAQGCVAFCPAPPLPCLPADSLVGCCSLGTGVGGHLHSASALLSAGNHTQITF